MFKVRGKGIEVVSIQSWNGDAAAVSTSRPIGRLAIGWLATEVQPIRHGSKAFYLAAPSSETATGRLGDGRIRSSA